MPGHELQYLTEPQCGGILVRYYQMAWGLFKGMPTMIHGYSDVCQELYKQKISIYTMYNTYLYIFISTIIKIKNVFVKILIRHPYCRFFNYIQRTWFMWEPASF